jgi:membrane-associated phospholipid phosphatase
MMMPSVLRKNALIYQIALVVGIALVLITFGIYPSTEIILGLLLILAIMNLRIRAFVFDFAPFLLLLFSYDTLRNFADNLSGTDIHIRDMITWERGVFGGYLPGYVLQHHLWGHFYTLALDIVTNTLYLSHFLTPLIAAALLWRYRRSQYWAFAIGLVVLSYAAFLTYILFPAAPPWWATHHGYLRSMPIRLDHFIVPAEVVSAGPNPVAAMPSLHTAYPTYIFLVCASVWGRKALPVILLPFGVAFSTVYLGHHYVIDALGGIAYAVFFFSTVFLWLKKREIVVRLPEKIRARTMTSSF